MPPVTASERMDARLASARTGLPGRLRFTFEVVSVIALLIAGSWFIVAGWGDFSNTVAITGFLVVGLTGAVLVIPLTLSSRHWLAGVAALVSVVTPTGFAYLPNILMVAVAVIEMRLAVAARATTG